MLPIHGLVGYREANRIYIYIYMIQFDDRMSGLGERERKRKGYMEMDLDLDFLVCKNSTMAGPAINPVQVLST